MISLHRLRLVLLVFGLLCAVSVRAHSNRLIMLIDERNVESLDQNEIKALGGSLKKAISEQAAPLLVTRNILLNYVARRSYTNHPTHSENSALIGSPFYKNIWRLFKINDSTLYLLIPTKLLPASLYATPLTSHKTLGFHFAHTRELSHLLPTTGDFYRGLRTFLKEDRDGEGLSQINLNKIFANQTKNHSALINKIPWNIFIDGHGNARGIIAGTQAAVIHKLLIYFDANLTTNLVYISSCFLGGPNKYLLAPTEKPCYNFTLALGAITDSVTVFHPAHLSFTQFFEKAEKGLSSRDGSYLIDTLQAVTPHSASKWSYHGITEQPQILTPDGFKVLAFDDTIIPLPHPNSTLNKFIPAPVSLRKTTPQQAADSSLGRTSREILYGKIAILLYANRYDDELSIAPTCAGVGLEDRNPFSAIPAAINLFIKGFFDLSNEESARHLPTTALVTKNMRAKVASAKNNTDLFTKAQHLFAPTNALFPVFISMLHTPHRVAEESIAPIRSHHFTSITIENSLNGIESPFFGIMLFLRDAFFDASCRDSRNVFMIDSLTGFNDFTIYFEQDFFVNQKPLSAFALALADHSHEYITFTDVIISTQGCLGASGKEMCIEIDFVFAEQTWNMKFQGKPEEFLGKSNWCFKRTDLTVYQ